MRKFLTFTATILITASALAAGDIYRWKDANGTWHYSDQPQPGAELVVRASRPVADGASEAPTDSAPAMATDDSASLPVSDAVAAQVRTEVATAKSAQCEKAEDAYQKSVQARRIFKTDEAGNKVYFSDAEIDAARLQARSARDLACGPGA